MNQIIVQEDFEINKVLNKPLMAYLSSSIENNPCSSPLWFLYDEDKIWLFGTDKDSFIKRLHANSNCAVSIVDFNLELGILQHVGVRGKASITKVDKKKLDKFLCKYLGNNKSNWSEWFIKKIVVPLNRMVTITPTSIVAKDASFFSKKAEVIIDLPLVQRLVNKQFPQWADLKIKPVESSGWDNRTFHLGDNMTIRLPSNAEYEPQVKKEQYWLPKLAPQLPLSIPKPIAMGKPTNEYPWHWSIYQWLEGQTVTVSRINDKNLFAKNLATFLKALQQCDTLGAPVAGPDNFYRGADLSIYDADTRTAIANIDDEQLASILTAIWEKALASTWQNDPVWVHGDIAVGNLLVNKGELVGVIDFGQLAIGDPACDLAIYWTFLSGRSREIFCDILKLDSKTWDRGRGWVLWKTLCAPIEGTDCDKILGSIIEEFNYGRN